MEQGVAAWCSVLQRVTACCSVLQCAAEYFSVLQCVVVCGMTCGELSWGVHPPGSHIVWCGVLQRVALSFAA